jgi:hypothetical protein
MFGRRPVRCGNSAGSLSESCRRAAYSQTGLWASRNGGEQARVDATDATASHRIYVSRDRALCASRRILHSVCEKLYCGVLRSSARYVQLPIGIAIDSEASRQGSALFVF